MTLKIERFRPRVRLSGELRSEHLAQVKTELRKCGNSAVLDLEEVNLADVEGVRFLNRCEAKGVSVVHCSPYIREWMSRERPRETNTGGTSRAMDMSGHSVLVAHLNGQRFTEASEAGLLVVAKRGETAAFDLLYRTYAERILRKVHGITWNREDAEDAVQEAFVSAFRHLQTCDGRSAFSTWLTRIGINSALMILRKKRNSHEVAPAQDSESGSTWEAMDSAPDPEQQYAEQERLKLVRDAIARLRPGIRRALEILKLQGRSVKEMASAFRFAQRKVVYLMPGRRCANRKFCAAYVIAIGVGSSLIRRINCSRKRGGWLPKRTQRRNFTGKCWRFIPIA